jgi:16S rRNA (cytosine967-C5)-methyltransferase
MEARYTAFKIIHDVIYKDKYSNMILESYMNNAHLSNEDRRLCMNITMGTLRNSIYLEYLLSPYIKDIANTKPMLLTILKMGIYQYLFMDRIPQYALVDESCNIAKKAVSKNSAGFVNAVLRNFIRKYKEEDKDIPPYIRYSCTTQAYNAMRTMLNESQCIDMLKSFNEPSDTYISINTHFYDKNEVIENMSKHGFEVSIIDDTCAKVVSNMSPSASDEYAKGAIIVQDEKAASIAKMLNAGRGMNVLDACASPGGKTMYIANMMVNTGKITACDIIESRVSKMKENVRRCGFSNIECMTKDMTLLYTDMIEKFDRVLVDAPCSGLGVAGKRPEIKLKYESADSLVITQRNLMQTCSRYVKKGGTLVYGTCTVNRMENQDVTERFLKSNTDYVFDEDFAERGFYAARLIRK